MNQSKTIIFDADGMVINLPMFSDIYAKDFNVPIKDILPFFQNEFQACVIGQADTKQVIKPYLKKWGWRRGVNKFLFYWFSTKHNLNRPLIDSIEKLRAEGVTCLLATNQDAYHTEYLKKSLRFDHIFDHVYSSADIGAKKPEPDFFDFMVNSGGVTPKQTLFFDDREDHVAKAAAYGFQAHLYSSLNQFTAFVNAYL